MPHLATEELLGDAENEEADEEAPDSGELAKDRAKRLMQILRMLAKLK